MNEKITHQHFDKTAYIYVRQSTVHQVRHHHQGRQRQYDLSDRARQLGFAQVVVIDDDQGKTGSGLVERPGFSTLLTAVCGGRAGAVFALEASRLARNNRDWHHLIDLCALTSTLIIDGEGVYDPKQVNDRLLLGLKGTMSEFELSLFRQRARKAFEMKVAAGHAMWEIPIGFTRDENDRIEKIADRQVQTAIAGVFVKFRELGSARQTALWYRDQTVSLPEAVRGTRSRQANWRLPSVSRIRQVLKNPCYAGALAYGRTEAKVSVDNGRARKSGTRTAKPQDKWKVLLRENHEGYITWQEYEENQLMLNANTAARQPTANGKAKNGPALLGGLLRCAHCGRKLFVGYSGSAGSIQRYNCNGGREERGSAACQSLGGIDVDRAISDAVLETIAPAGIEAALLAMEKFDTQKDQRCQSLELALEKARYEVDRARRQYDEVDPANRLVAGELETRWNKALENVAKLELQLQELQLKREELTDEERAQLIALSQDLPILWNHESATPELKKQILRTVIEEIVIGDDEQRTHHQLTVHWKGGVHTALSVKRRRAGQRSTNTTKTALELIEELSKVCSDQTIAATLNRLGLVTGAGKTWRVHSVHSARYLHKLPNHRKAKAWVTVEAAAKELGVSHTVIRRLIRENTMPAHQVVETTPWIIARESLLLPAVILETEAVRAGRQSKIPNRKQANLPLI